MDLKTLAGNLQAIAYQSPGDSAEVLVADILHYFFDKPWLHRIPRNESEDNILGYVAAEVLEAHRQLTVSDDRFLATNRNALAELSKANLPLLTKAEAGSASHESLLIRTYASVVTQATGDPQVGHDVDRLMNAERIVTIKLFQEFLTLRFRQLRLVFDESQKPRSGNIGAAELRYGTTSGRGIITFARPTIKSGGHQTVTFIGNSSDETGITYRLHYCDARVHVAIDMLRTVTNNWPDGLSTLRKRLVVNDNLFLA